MTNPTEQPLALRLAEELSEDYCHCLPAYKDRGMVDPLCESCNTSDWRKRAAAELRRLTAEVERLKLLADIDHSSAEHWRKEAERLGKPGHVWVPVAVVDFLRGAGPLDGAWFGDRHPSERGAYWWRNRLQAAQKDQPQDFTGDIGHE